MKKLIFLSLAIGLFACSKEKSSIEVFHPNVLKSSVQSQSPYNTVGLIHNQYLDGLKVGLDTCTTISSAVQLASNLAESDSIDFNFEQGVEIMDSVASIVQSSDASFSSQILYLYNQGEISVSLYSKLQPIGKALNVDDFSISGSDTLSEITSYFNDKLDYLTELEDSLLNISFSDQEEEKAVLSAISICRHSLTFWVGVINDTHHPFHDMLVDMSFDLGKTAKWNRFWESTAIVVGLDVLGGLAGVLGGVTIGFAGVMAGVASGLGVIGLLWG